MAPSKLGRLQFVGNRGPIDVHVFDDALVVVEAGKGHEVARFFGPIAGGVAGVHAARQMEERRAQAESIGDVTAREFVQAVEGTTLIPAADITRAHLEKTRGKTGKLTVSTADGKSRTFLFTFKIQAPEQIEDALHEALGERFVGSITAKP
jgi:hypothetical protein